MLSAVGIIMFWTWGLTPLWVNIVVTILLGIRFWFRLIKLMSEFFQWLSDGKHSEEVTLAKNTGRLSDKGYPVEKVGD